VPAVRTTGYAEIVVDRQTITYTYGGSSDRRDCSRDSHVTPGRGVEEVSDAAGPRGTTPTRLSGRRRRQ